MTKKTTKLRGKKPVVQQLPKSRLKRYESSKIIFIYLVVILPLSIVSYQAIKAALASPIAGAKAQLTLNQSVYKIGQNVVFKISNPSSSTIYIDNHCPGEPLAVYQWLNNQWQRIHDTTDVAKCAGEPRLYSIAPGQSATADYSYWPHLFNTPGRYRIVAEISSYSTGPALEFTVTN